LNQIITLAYRGNPAKCH